MKKKHDELEVKMKDKEKRNKKYAESYSSLLKECTHATEKNKLLSRLKDCLSTTVIPQTFSISREENTHKTSFKVLLDTLKSLKFINTNPLDINCSLGAEIFKNKTMESNDAEIQALTSVKSIPDQNDF